MDTPQNNIRYEDVAAKLAWQSPVLTKVSIEDAEANVLVVLDGGAGLS